MINGRMTVDVACGTIRSHGFNPTVTPDGVIFTVPHINTKAFEALDGDGYYEDIELLTIDANHTVCIKEVAYSLGY